MRTSIEAKAEESWYAQIWSSAGGVEEFGRHLSAAWVSAYLASTGACADDLVDVDPGNGFTYTFDLAGSISDDPAAWEPRVIGVWGRSQPGGPKRDKNRMRGFPRPRRGQDDRGHLISCAAGGGYDINLVAMDAALNRGTSSDGKRFRELERRSAATPGALFFVRAIYEDDSARPCRFDVGAQAGAELIVEVFDNPKAETPISTSPLRRAAQLSIDPDLVAGCLDVTRSGDELFRRGWQHGPSSLTHREKCAVAGVTGHVAESVTELLLDALEWRVLWHFTGPGGHGADLVYLTPDDKVVVIEVKGTLVHGRIPRLSRRELAQMSASWIDKADNPAMVELGLDSDDVYGGVVVINFADLTWRTALTEDFAVLRPVASLAELADLAWVLPVVS